MCGSQNELRTIMLEDANCVFDGAGNSSWSIQWLEHESTMCVQVEFRFPVSDRQTEQSGVRFRFFYLGEVEYRGFQDGSELFIRDRASSFRFQPPAVDPNDIEDFDELQFFLSSVEDFVNGIAAEAKLPRQEIFTEH